MKWTRLSFFYLMSYLTGGGLGFVAAPDLALELLGAQQAYSIPMTRLAGGLMLALGIIVVEIVRKRIELLYRTTIVVRVLLLGIMVALFVGTSDRLFLVLGGIVGLGMILTSIGLVADRSVTRGRT